MPRISAVSARQIIDSRGRPTVEATVQLDDGTSASSSVASGAVTNKLEAVELRDHNSNEYFGLGVSQAVKNVTEHIAPVLIGMDPLYQTQIDQKLVDLDGTTTKSKLGANAILSVSQAVMKAAAASLKLPVFVYVKEKYQLISHYRIPTPIFNLMNGGRHGSGTLDFQEFQLVPASHLPYGRALRIGVEMFMAIDKLLEQKGAIRAVGVEGGFSPNLATNADALEIFAEAIKLTSYTLAQDAFLGLDVGPRWFAKGGKFTVKDRPQPMTAKELIKYFGDLHQQFRVFSFEDPLPDDAWDDWKFMTSELGRTAMISADDLTATNKTLVMKAIQEQACNALVIKPNRVGSVTETIEIASIAHQAGWHTILSHRSGETTDDFWADVAVGIGTDYVKFGAPSRGERVVKYNRLLRIEEILEQTQTETSDPQRKDSMDFSANNGNQDAPPASSAPTTFGAPPAAPIMPSPVPSMTDASPAPSMTPATPAPSMAPLSPTPVPEMGATAAPVSAPTPLPTTEPSALPGLSLGNIPTPTTTPAPTPTLSPTPIPSSEAPAAPAVPSMTPATPAPSMAPLSPTPIPEASAAAAPAAAGGLPELSLGSQMAYQPPSDAATPTNPTGTPQVEPELQASIDALAQELGTANPGTPAPTPTPVPAPTPIPSSEAPAAPAVPSMTPATPAPSMAPLSPTPIPEASAAAAPASAPSLGGLSLTPPTPPTGLN